MNRDRSFWFSIARLTSLFGRFTSDRGGNVSAILAATLVPLIGVLGLAGEVSGWYYTQRSMQNAADTAALAAASNDCTTSTCGPTYDKEAKAAAAKYGYVDGTNSTTVNASYPVACPDGTTTCFKVTLSKTVPLILVPIASFTGNGSGGQVISATALASRKALDTGNCMLALATGLPTSTNAIRLAGGGSALDMGGCPIFSNASASCPGGASAKHANFDISVSGTVSGSNGCGATQNDNQAVIQDPFKYLGTSIPPSSKCGSFTQTSGTLDWSGKTCMYWAGSGNLTLSNNLTITTDSTAGGTILVIPNGESIDLSRYTFSASYGNPLTIIFTGTSGAPGFITGANGSVIDFGAPNTGTWSGVALYQDPSLTTTSNITYSGSSPEFNLTGLLYAPYATLTVNGTINTETGGLNCVAFVADQISLGGNVSFFNPNPTIQCSPAGLVLPTAPGTASRQALVG